MLYRLAIALCCLFLFSPSLSQAQESYVDWDTVTPPSAATFVFDSLTGTVAVTNGVNWAGSLNSIGTADGSTNYPDVWFTPTPPAALEYLSSGAQNAAGGSVGSADWVVTFSGPVDDPKFHFLNLDAATIDFAATTEVGGDPVVLIRLSGNPEFEVTGTVVNSTTATPAAAGCEDAGGGNPNGACGTVELSGTYETVVMTVTDTDTSTASGDGFLWTISAPGPVPVELMQFTID